MDKTIEEVIIACERKRQLATVCFLFNFAYSSNLIISGFFISFHTFSIFLLYIFSFYFIKARHDQLLRNGQPVPPALVSFIIDAEVMLMKYREVAQSRSHKSLQPTNRSLTLTNATFPNPTSSLIKNPICTPAPISSTSLPSTKQCNNQSPARIPHGI